MSAGGSLRVYDIGQLLKEHVLNQEEADPICNACSEVWPCIVYELACQVSDMQARAERAEEATIALAEMRQELAEEIAKVATTWGKLKATLVDDEEVFKEFGRLPGTFGQLPEATP